MLIPSSSSFLVISLLLVVWRDASFAFASGLAKTHIAKLNSVQSMALRMTCNSRRGTPLKGLEVILDVPPIDLFIKAESTKTNFRLIGTNEETVSRKGHINREAETLATLGLLNSQPDKMGKERIWQQNYKTCITKSGHDIQYGLRCYTDGSKTARGTGAGFCIMEGNKILKTRAFGLTKTATVFQAELHAIRMAVPFIESTFETGSEIAIMCDSQAAIKAIQEIDTTSMMVKLTKAALNRLGEHYTVCVNWIKAHVDHKGNEMADIIAKAGCSLNPEQITPLSSAHVKTLVKEELYKAWDRRWQTQLDCRQTFQFFPCVDQRKSKVICKMGRSDLGIMIRYLTGHAHLRRHNMIANTQQEIYVDRPRMRYNLQDPDDNHTGTFDDRIMCRLCQLPGREETPYHLARECLRIWGTRREILGGYSFEGDELFNWEPKPLLEFFKHFDLENKPNSL